MLLFHGLGQFCSWTVVCPFPARAWELLVEQGVPAWGVLLGVPAVSTGTGELRAPRQQLSRADNAAACNGSAAEAPDIPCGASDAASVTLCSSL